MFADIHSVRNFRVTLKIKEATASKTKWFMDLKKNKNCYRASNLYLRYKNNNR